MTLLVLSGQRGAGKSHLAWALARTRGFTYIPSVTTRPPRPGETAGVDKVFVSRAQFTALRASGSLLCTRRYHDHWYGHDKARINTAARTAPAVCELLAEDILSFKDEYPHAVSVHIVPRDPREVAARLAVRASPHASASPHDADGGEWAGWGRKTLPRGVDAAFINTYDMAAVNNFFALINNLAKAPKP